MNKLCRWISIGIFMAFELACLSVILFADGKIVTAFSFIAVSSAFLFSLIFISFKKENYLTQIALFFTVIADIFLVLVKPMNQAIVMTSFSLTQIIYFILLLRQSDNKKLRLASIISRTIVVVGVIIATIIVVKDKVDYVALISMFYYANLIMNLIFAFINFRKNPLFAFGLLFFLLCDTFIGLNVAVGTYINVPETSILYKMAHPNFNWAWLFYVPSQTLISLSSVIHKRNKAMQNA